MSDEILKITVTPLKANNIFSFNEVCQMFPFLETYCRVKTPNKYPFSVWHLS